MTWNTLISIAILYFTIALYGDVMGSKEYVEPYKQLLRESIQLHKDYFKLLEGCEQ